jgi:NhaD family Na+/H+ antiporter
VAISNARQRLVGKLFVLFVAVFSMSVLPTLAFAAETHGAKLDLTSHWVGYTAVAVFVAAYIFVMLEEMTHLRKSKPVILAAGIIWAIIAWQYANNNMPHAAEVAVRHNILEYSELFLFLLVAMTYINAMSERGVFDWLRNYLVGKGYSFKVLFWLTGVLAFFISPVADNLTTALLMCAVIMAVAAGNRNFIVLGCINVVVAANAGGAFSPFGDITTLMVWQKGIVQFSEFFALFIPSVVNWLVPAVIMSFYISSERPKAVDEEVVIKPGGVTIIFLFLLTIATAVSFHNFLHLPPMLGMMTGLSFLQFYGYYLNRQAKLYFAKAEADGMTKDHPIGSPVAFDVFSKVARAEWDTLLFFFGVVLAVGGLGFIGYLALLSEGMYAQLGPTTANILVGILSAIVDNIPVMFAVLTMQPEMNHAQWLLVTLTAGVGGSLLSIGSAAGVALMGQARGYYTFGAHLKWTWAIALGYVASIWVHILLNGS